MIEVGLKGADMKSELKVELYNTISRIPLNIAFCDAKFISNVITYDIFSEGNFMEFRFDQNSLELCEITIVSINNDSVEYLEDFIINIPNKAPHSLIIQKKDTSLYTRLDRKIRIIRTPNSICIYLCKEDELEYFKSLGDLYFGVDSQGHLCALYLDNLPSEALREVFGC